MDSHLGTSASNKDGLANPVKTTDAPSPNRVDVRPHGQGQGPRGSQSQSPDREEEQRATRWKFRSRAMEDDGPQQWWFAAIAIPLIAATTGPLANMFSIAAIVSPWRATLPDNGLGPDDQSIGFPDPAWCIPLNVVSLVCGCVGNVSLLLNFTRQVPYILALPMTIVTWLLASIILISIEVAVDVYEAPQQPYETYTQGFWYAVIAAILYLLSTLGLMVNMLGYFLGHYPRHFTLTDHQRTLILQTMSFIIWLAGAAGMFAKVNSWNFADALYFCVVTTLTVGFGDFVPENDLSKALNLPFAVVGIVMLGLIVSSISRFMRDLSNDNVYKKRLHKRRERTIALWNASLMEPSGSMHRRPDVGADSKDSQYPKDGRRKAASTNDRSSPEGHTKESQGLRKRMHIFSEKQKLLPLREERQRFEAMRQIEHRTRRWRRWYKLAISVTAFLLVWTMGAVALWRAEQRAQPDLTYYRALYFCYVSLLTVGYGDLSPRSNAGRPVFVIWSLVAIPTMTILVSDMADTVIAVFNRGTFALADWTVMPKAGLWRSLFERNPWMLLWLQKKSAQIAPETPLEEGLQAQRADGYPPTLEALARGPFDEHQHARNLVAAIRKTARHAKTEPRKKYSYEEWVLVTRLIRFGFGSLPEQQKSISDDSNESHRASDPKPEGTSGQHGQMPMENDEEDIDWDWIGEDSPLLADEGEPEWILDNLCCALEKYFRRTVPPRKMAKHQKTATEHTGTVEPGQRAASDLRDDQCVGGAGM